MLNRKSGRPHSWRERPMRDRGRRMQICVAVGGVLLAVAIKPGLAPAQAADSMSSAPPDTTRYSRPPVAEDFAPPRPPGPAPVQTAPKITVSVVDAVVNN